VTIASAVHLDLFFGAAFGDVAASANPRMRACWFCSFEASVLSRVPVDDQRPNQFEVVIEPLCLSPSARCLVAA